MWRAGLMLTAVALVWVSPSFAQANRSEKPEPKPEERAAVEPFRVLAPGVMQSVTSDRQLAESFSRHDVVELVAVNNDFDWAKEITFRHEIWCLQFKFKPVRMIHVDVPQDTGRMQRKLIWYMIYSVTNADGAMQPVKDEDGTYSVREVERAVRFIPEFLLESPEYNKAYPDRIIPVAMGLIQQREDPRRKFYNSVEIPELKIEPGQTVWGVATWENIDPRIDRFSIYIQGLTNAYRWKDEPGKYKPGDTLGTGRRLSRKTLKLNFWRPGDEFFENEREIRYGIPGEVDYQWVYR